LDLVRGLRDRVIRFEEFVLDGRQPEGRQSALKAGAPETLHPFEARQTTKTIARLIFCQNEPLFSDSAT
jgi:hypothetical protein